ncbi:MAG: TIGR00159 family protein [SAR324 cluster bacterium]|nr:TIGR00159 family protein [SAR324 cluster bacterium]
MENIFSNVGWQDIIDISLLTFIFYRLLVFFKGTRTIPILAGFTLLLALYLLSQILQLEAIGLLLDNLANSLVLVLVILFQAEIRNALAQFGLITFLTGSGRFKKDVLDEAIQGSFLMARERIGALIVFEREVGLRNFIEKGTAIDAVLTKEVLISIFRPTSPLHDGAAIVDRKGRLAAARCLLPITTSTKISPILGTRHRAAIGLTEETDAIVLIVSEERSEISLSHKGELIRGSSQQDIKKVLFELMDVKAQEPPVTLDTPQTDAVETEADIEEDEKSVAVTV